MAKAADFDGKANETEVVTSESVKGKRKTSILGTKARLWLITINNPQNHGISLEQSGILERFKEDIKTGRVTYVASVMEQSLTVDENDKPRPVPGLTLENESEQAEWLAGEKRRELRGQIVPDGSAARLQGKYFIGQAVLDKRPYWCMV